MNLISHIPLKSTRVHPCMSKNLLYLNQKFSLFACLISHKIAKKIITSLPRVTGLVQFVQVLMLLQYIDYIRHEMTSKRSIWRTTLKSRRNQQSKKWMKMIWFISICPDHQGDKRKRSISIVSAYSAKSWSVFVNNFRFHWHIRLIYQPKNVWHRKENK